jgi:hypothetical protein
MYDVPVNVVMYTCLPAQEFTLNLRGDTTLGELRGIICSATGGGAPIDTAWVAFVNDHRKSIPFGHTRTESDGLQLRFLRSSPTGPVSVGALRNIMQPEGAEVIQPSQPGQGTKRTADDADAFVRSSHARV